MGEARSNFFFSTAESVEISLESPSFSRRLEDTLNLNTKLDHHIKNKDEKIKELESLLQAEEDRQEITIYPLHFFSFTLC